MRLIVVHTAAAWEPPLLFFTLLLASSFARAAELRAVDTAVERVTPCRPGMTGRTRVQHE